MSSDSAGRRGAEGSEDPTLGVALIADIVGSRKLPDRVGAQIAIEDAIDRVEREVIADRRRPLRATVGDEFQGTFGALADALRTTLMLQLLLPERIELRFGIGIGGLVEISSGPAVVTEGPGWWAARAAIGIASRRQRRQLPRTRTRLASAVSVDASVRSQVPALNAYLTMRDELVGAMSERQRRITHSRLSGMSQAEIAEAEGITQPAVSKALRMSGSAAIIAAIEEF